MEKPKVYIETTLFNYYFDSDSDVLHTDTVKLFAEIAEGKYDAFTSEAVTEELKIAPSPKKEKMLALLNEYPITLLPVGETANKLADIYVAEGIIPLKYRTDGVHIAVAAMKGLDYVISMNFKHIVKITTMIRANAVNVLNGFRQISIISPMEIVANEDT